jgi:hypothetical protein
MLSHQIDRLQLGNISYLKRVVSLRSLLRIGQKLFVAHHRQPSRSPNELGASRRRRRPRGYRSARAIAGWRIIAPRTPRVWLGAALLSTPYSWRQSGRDRAIAAAADQRPQIARQLGMRVSTVGGVLRRLGLNRLAALDDKPAVVRYERQRPGELIHLDTK